MNRRRFIAGIGTASTTGLAGCLRAAGTSTPERRLSLADQDTVSEEYSVQVNVVVLESEFTAEHPATIRVTTTNTGSARDLSVRHGRCSLFDRSKAGSDSPAGLWLHSPGTDEFVERDGNRWRMDRPASEPRQYLMYGCTLKRFEPGESVSNEYEVWDDYQTDGYLEPDTYRWEERTYVGERKCTEERPSFTWGFSLTVE